VKMIFWRDPHAPGAHGADPHELFPSTDCQSLGIDSSGGGGRWLRHPGGGGNSSAAKPFATMLWGANQFWGLHHGFDNATHPEQYVTRILPLSVKYYLLVRLRPLVSRATHRIALSAGVMHIPYRC
jgi:hypothetical protein